MKKEKFMKLFLILLPVLAVGLAAATDSVMVFDRLAGTTEYYSYFDLIPVVSLQMCTPLAGMMCVLAGCFAVLFVFLKKEWSLKAVSLLSFAAALAAVIPVLIQGDVMVVPNVGIPIFMIGQYLFAFFLKKQFRSAPGSLKNRE